MTNIFLNKDTHVVFFTPKWVLGDQKGNIHVPQLLHSDAASSESLDVMP